MSVLTVGRLKLEADRQAGQRVGSGGGKLSLEARRVSGSTMLEQLLLKAINEGLIKLRAGS